MFAEDHSAKFAFAFCMYICFDIVSFLFVIFMLIVKCYMYSGK